MKYKKTIFKNHNYPCKDRSGNSGHFLEDQLGQDIQILFTENLPTLQYVVISQEKVGDYSKRYQCANFYLGGNNRNNAPECPECKSPLIPVSSLKSVGPTFWECTICGIYCKKEIRETKQLSNEVESISNGKSQIIDLWSVPKQNQF